MGSIILGVCLFCAFYTSYRVIGQSSRPRKQKILISLFFLITFLFPLILKNKGDLSGAFYSICYTGAYFLFITAALFFCLIAVRDVIWAFLCIREKVKKVESPRFKWNKPLLLGKSNRFLFILATAICVYSLYAGLKTPNVKETVLISDRIQKPITIAVLGDMHLSRTISKNKIKKIVERTNKAEPDVILLPGDTIDDQIKYIQPHLDELKNLKAPLGIYATAGNHEIMKNYDESKVAFESLGVTYLFNDGVKLGNNIFLAGIPDTKTVKHINEPVDLQKAFNAADITNFKILVSHRPKVIDSLTEGVIDLVIAAHTHGGQIFPFHILSKLDNKYLAGLYEEKNSMLYVSRGCGQWGPQMRFLAPSEISIIRILPWADEAARKSLKNNKKGQKNNKDADAQSTKKDSSESLSEKGVVYPVKDEKTENFVDSILGKSQKDTQDTTVQQLKEAQKEADKEASEAKASEQKEPVQAPAVTAPVNNSQEKATNASISSKVKEAESALEEAKESLDQAFEQVLSNKVQDDLTAERKKNEALQVEITQLRIDLDKTKSDASKIIVRQNAAIKLLEEERNLLKKALEDQHNAFAAELKASQDVIENQRRIIAREQELSRQTLALQKELVRELELLKEDLKRYQRTTLAQQNRGTIYQPQATQGYAQNIQPARPAQYIQSPLKPIQRVQSDRMPQQEQRREERFANMEVIYHPNGAVTRQMVKTVIIEYPTYISAVKNVASYTTTPEEEARTNPTVVENALRKALGLPLIEEVRTQKKPLLLPLGNPATTGTAQEFEEALSQQQAPTIFGTIYKN